MAQEGLKFCFAAFMVHAVLTAAANAQSGSGCSTAIAGLDPCLNYVYGKEVSPSQKCCSELTSIAKTEPHCLCYLLKGGASSAGVSVDQAKARALPSTCKVHGYLPCQCGGEEGTPTTPSTNEHTPATPSTNEGSPATPSTNEGTPDIPTTPTMPYPRSSSEPYSPYSSTGGGGSVIRPGTEFSDACFPKVPYIFISSLLFLALSAATLQYRPSQ